MNKNTKAKSDKNITNPSSLGNKATNQSINNQKRSSVSSNTSNNLPKTNPGIKKRNSYLSSYKDKINYENEKSLNESNSLTMSNMKSPSSSQLLDRKSKILEQLKNEFSLSEENFNNISLISNKKISASVLNLNKSRENNRLNSGPALASEILKSKLKYTKSKNSLVNYVNEVNQTNPNANDSEIMNTLEYSKIKSNEGEVDMIDSGVLSISSNQELSQADELENSNFYDDKKLKLSKENIINEPKLNENVTGINDCINKSTTLVDAVNTSLNKLNNTKNIIKDNKLNSSSSKNLITNKSKSIYLPNSSNNLLNEKEKFKKDVKNKSKQSTNGNKTKTENLSCKSLNDNSNTKSILTRSNSLNERKLGISSILKSIINCKNQLSTSNSDTNNKSVTDNHGNLQHENSLMNSVEYTNEFNVTINKSQLNENENVSLNCDNNEIKNDINSPNVKINFKNPKTSNYNNPIEYELSDLENEKHLISRGGKKENTIDKKINSLENELHHVVESSVEIKNDDIYTEKCLVNVKHELSRIDEEMSVKDAPILSMENFNISLSSPSYFCKNKLIKIRENDINLVKNIRFNKFTHLEFQNTINENIIKMAKINKKILNIDTIRLNYLSSIYKKVNNSNNYKTQNVNFDIINRKRIEKFKLTCENNIHLNNDSEFKNKKIIIEKTILAEHRQNNFNIFNNKQRLELKTIKQFNFCLPVLPTIGVKQIPEMFINKSNFELNSIYQNRKNLKLEASNCLNLFLKNNIKDLHLSKTIEFSFKLDKLVNKKLSNNFIKNSDFEIKSQPKIKNLVSTVSSTSYEIKSVKKPKINHKLDNTESLMITHTKMSKEVTALNAIQIISFSLNVSKIGNENKMFIYSPSSYDRKQGLKNNDNMQPQDENVEKENENGNISLENSNILQNSFEETNNKIISDRAIVDQLVQNPNKIRNGNKKNLLASQSLHNSKFMERVNALKQRNEQVFSENEDLIQSLPQQNEYFCDDIEISDEELNNFQEFYFGKMEFLDKDMLIKFYKKYLNKQYNMQNPNSFEKKTNNNRDVFEQIKKNNLALLEKEELENKKNKKKIKDLLDIKTTNEFKSQNLQQSYRFKYRADIPIKSSMNINTSQNNILNSVSKTDFVIMPINSINKETNSNINSNSISNSSLNSLVFNRNPIMEILKLKK